MSRLKGLRRDPSRRSGLRLEERDPDQARAEEASCGQGPRQGALAGSQSLRGAACSTRAAPPSGARSLAAGFPGGLRHGVFDQSLEEISAAVSAGAEVGDEARRSVLEVLANEG
jgi:hypothetical protein